MMRYHFVGAATSSRGGRVIIRGEVVLELLLLLLILEPVNVEIIIFAGVQERR